MVRREHDLQRASDRVVEREVSPWEQHALAGIPKELREEWSWTAPLKSLHRSEMRRPEGGRDGVVLDASGLCIPYYCGVIHIEFGERRFTLLAVDQKTPAEERWEIEPGKKWWKKAFEIEWPLVVLSTHPAWPSPS